MIDRFQVFSSAVAGMYRYIQRIARAEMEKVGLKGPHAQCLIALHGKPEGLTSVQLTKICDRDKAAISRILAELERENMVQRQLNKGHTYRARLVLTDRGREVAERISQRATLAVETAGMDLTEEQRKNFYKAMDLIAARLQVMSDQGLE